MAGTSVLAAQAVRIDGLRQLAANHAAVQLQPELVLRSVSQLPLHVSAKRDAPHEQVAHWQSARQLEVGAATVLRQMAQWSL